MVRGENIIMNNVNLQKQSPLGLFYDENVLNRKDNHNKIIQIKISHFNDLIKATYLKIYEFLKVELERDLGKSEYDYRRKLLAQVLIDYTQIEKSGIPILDNMSESVQGKNISKDTFDLLVEIINHQLEITEEILQRDIIIGRIEILLNHLREVSFYLKTDLELETIPDKKSVQFTIRDRYPTQIIFGE